MLAYRSIQMHKEFIVNININSNMSHTSDLFPAASTCHLNASGNETSKLLSEEQEMSTDLHGSYYMDEIGNKIYLINGCPLKHIVVDKKLVPIEILDGQIKVIVNSEKHEGVNFIVKKLKEPLRNGLAQVFVQKPDDPIGFLIRYLLKFQCNKLQHRFEKSINEEHFSD